MELEPRIEILPPAQLKFWRERNVIPFHFVLYGGTALALRLGHRVSEDFDFFANASFKPQNLLERISYLRDAKVMVLRENTLTCVLDRNGPVPVVVFRRIRA